MALSKNKQFLAVAEQSDKAIISIIDLHTRKRKGKGLVTSEAQSTHYVSMSWSPDGEWLIAQGAEPEWKLVLWKSPAGPRSQVMFSDKVQNNNQGEAFQCLFHPTADQGTVTVIGNSVQKVLKLVVENREGMLKTQGYGMGKVGEGQQKLLLSHAWLVDGEKDRMLLGTELGEVFVLDPEHNWDPVKVLQGPEGVTAACIAPHSGGKAFVVGGSQGTVSFFGSQENDKDPYRLLRTVQIKGEMGTVKSISISQSEEHMVLTTSTNQIWTMEIAHGSEVTSGKEENPCRLLVASFHSGEITGLDTCMRKPLLATCSSTIDDSTVKLWNYNERTCELSCKFEEQPLCVSLHPTGYILLCGFTDKLRLMTVLMDDLKTTREYPIKACRECRFSHGGHLFVATDPHDASNPNTIKVFSTYTGEQVAELNRHASRVWSLQWSPDDTRLISTSSEGMVIEWNMRTFKQMRFHQTRNMYYSTGVLSLDCKSIYAAGRDGGVKEFGPDAEVVRHAEEADELEYSQVVVSDNGKALFAATEAGTVKVLKLPLTTTAEAVTIKAHAYMPGKLPQMCIPRMCVGDMGSLVVTAGHDGCLVVFQVTRDKEASKAVDRGREAMPLAEEVLVTKADLEEKQRQMTLLEQRVLDNKAKYEWEMNLLDSKMQDEITKLTTKFTDELEKDRRNYTKLLADKEEMRATYDEKIRSSDLQQQSELRQLEATYEDKIQLEAQRFQELVQKMERMKEQFEETDASLHARHEQTLEQVKVDFLERLTEEQEKSTLLEQQKQELARDFEEIRDMMEQDADKEIQELTHSYEAALAKEKEDAAGLAHKNTSMSQSKENLEKEIDKLKQEIRRLFDQEKHKYASIQAHEKDKETLRKEMREREETIAEKEKRIYDLKKKNQELEKFKWMLEYKIKDLLTLIEPRQAEIAAMKEQVREMVLELERYQKQNSSLELTISELKLRLGALSGEQDSQKVVIEARSAAVRRFQRDLHNAAQAIGDMKTLKERVKILYQDYAQTEEEELTKSSEVASEHGRQRDYLERTVESLKRKLAKDADKARADNGRIMAEHVALVQEINDLRREMRALQGRPIAPTLRTLQSAKSSRGDRTGALDRELAMQLEALQQLEDELEQKRGLLRQTRSRPASGRLPPLPERSAEGFAAEPPSLVEAAPEEAALEAAGEGSGGEAGLPEQDSVQDLAELAAGDGEANVPAGEAMEGPAAEEEAAPAAEEEAAPASED